MGRHHLGRRRVGASPRPGAQRPGGAGAVRPQIAGLDGREDWYFVGRRREQRRWPADLIGPGPSGIVVFGIGGTGKTTLAARTRSAACCHSSRGSAGSGRRSGMLRCSVNGLPVHVRLPHRISRAYSVSSSGPRALPPTGLIGQGYGRRTTWSI